MTNQNEIVKRKRVLFVLDKLSVAGNATIHIAMRLAQELGKKYDLYVVTKCSYDGDLDSDKVNLFKGVRYFSSGSKVDSKVDEFYTKVYKEYSWQTITKLRKVFILASHPIKFIRYVPYVLWRRFADETLRKLNREAAYYVKEIEDVCRIWDIDIVITFVMPYHLAVAVANASIGAKKFLFQGDFFTGNSSYKKSKESTKENIRKLEAEVMKKLDCVFVLDSIFHEISRLGLADQNKLVCVPLPASNFCDDQNAIQSSPAKTPEDDSDKIKFVYTGLFYDNIRSPHFLLSLFEKLPDNYELHFLGSGSAATVYKFKPKLKDRLICYGWTNASEVQRMIKEADVLVCVNNNANSNQMSSKLFEYIQTGKPVLNIYSKPDCPSLRYISKYDNHINIKEGGIDQAMIDTVTQFVVSHRGKVIPYEEILERYRENTTSYVANIIEKEFEER